MKIFIFIPMFLLMFVISSCEKNAGKSLGKSRPTSVTFIDINQEWKYQSGGNNGMRAIMYFKINNESSKKINSVNFRTVWIKNNSEQMDTGQKTIRDIESGLTSEPVIILGNNVYGFSCQEHADWNCEVERLNNNLSVRLYYTINAATEELLFEKPFKAEFSPGALR